MTTNTVEPLEIELSSDESIEKAKADVEAKYGRVDALINNAGATYDIDYLKGKLPLRECFTKSYDVNVVSPSPTPLPSLFSLPRTTERLLCG